MLPVQNLLPRNRSQLMLALGGLALVLGVLRLAVMTPQCAQRNDFAHYYVSSRALLDGENPYTVSLAERYAALGFEFDERIPSATNPPALLWLFAPFAVLPPIYACAAWQLLQLLTLAGMMWLMWRLTKSHISPTVMCLVACAVIFSNPVYWHFYHSQVQLLLGAMLLLAFWWNQKGRHTWASSVIVAAGAIKLFPLVLLPWFLWSTDEPWREKLKRSVVAGVFGVSLFLITGPSLWLAFVAHGLEVVTSNAVNRTFNFGLPSLLGNVAHAAWNFDPPEAIVEWSRRLGILAGLLLIGLGYLVCWKGKQNRPQQFALLTILMLAGGATMWGHYLVMLAFPGVVVALSVIESKRTLPKAIVAAALLMIMMAGTGSPQLSQFPVANVLSHYLPLAAVLTLAIVLGLKLLQAQPQRDARTLHSLPNTAS